MTPYINLAVFSAFIFFLICSSKSEDCPNVLSIKAVGKCPTNKEEYDEAAHKKQCSQIAAKHNCSTAYKYIYHCVINSFRNGTLEACAPEKIIFGHCTEYNEGGRVIQQQKSSLCNNTGFPKCAAIYNSSQAYQYQDCYHLNGKPQITYSTTYPTDIFETQGTEINHSKADKSAIWVPIVVAVILLSVIVLVIVILYKRKKRRFRGQGNKKITKTTAGESDKTVHADDEREKLILDTTVERGVTVINEAETGTSTDKFSFAARKRTKDLSETNKADSKEYLTYYEIIDNYFVETSDYQRGEELFHKYGVVIWIGPPGCGKTLAAIHLIFKHFKHTNEELTFRKIRTLKELSYIEEDKNTSSLIFIDNIFFSQGIESDLQNWWNELGSISEKYFQSNESEKGFRVHFIITARENVLERACSFMGKTTPLLNERYRINVKSITETEKDDILSQQILFAIKERNVTKPAIDDEFRRKVKASEGPIGFPLCAHLFACSEEYQKSGVSFFSHPTDYLKRQINYEIERDKTNRTKSLFFVLFFHEWHTKLGYSDKLQIKSDYQCKWFLEKISKVLLPNFEPFDFRSLEHEAQRLVGAFLKEENDNNFKFVHDSVYEAVGSWLCETFRTETAKYFPLEIIQNHDYETAKEDINAQTILAARLLYETLHQRVSQVFASKCFQLDSFCKCFRAELLEKDTKTITDFLSVTNESTAVKLPCMFWTGCNKLTYLTEQFYNIVQNYPSLNSDYHLYVSLYGECCARKKGLLLTVNGMLRDNLQGIKDRVIEFRDDDDNSILHLVITSDRTDKFASDVVQKLLNDGMNVDIRNNNNKTPLMLAVSQRMDRFEVLENLMRFKPNMQSKDTQSFNVFHYCLSSCNDDETCSKYLKTLLKGENAKRCLIKEDAKGNTPLCVATMETRHSRILSILTLCDEGSNEIRKINGDGFSPLQLSISYLKEEKSLLAEFESCVRVILLLLFGGSPDNKSDKNDKAITECNLEVLKKILEQPKEEKNMIQGLEAYLEKVEKSRDTADSVPTLFNKVGKNMRIHIYRATQILKNCRLKTTK